MKTFIFMVMTCLFTVNIVAVGSFQQFIEKDTLIIINDETKQQTHLIKGKQVKLKLSNGDRVKGNITGLGEENVWINGTKISLDEIKAITHPEKKKFWRKVEAISLVGLGGSGIVGGIIILITVLIPAGGMFSELLAIIFAPLGALALILGIVLLIPGIRWLKAAWKRFKLGKKFRTKLK